MAEELGFRFILQDEGSTAAAAQPTAAPTPEVSVAAALQSSVINTLDPLGDQFAALHEQAAAVTAELEALKEAAGQAAEAQATDEPAEQQPVSDPREQARLNDAATSAMDRASKSIVGAFQNSLPFGHVLATLQAIAQPIVDSLDAIEAARAAQSGTAVAAPAATPPPGGGGGAVVPAPAGLLSGAGSATPLIAVAAAAAAGAVALYAAAKAAGAVDSSLQKLAERLAPLNAELAASQARAGVEGLLQDIRSAQTLGADLADFTTSRSSISRSLQRIEDVLAKFALEKINPLLDTIADLLEKISENGPALQAALDVMFRTAFPLLSAALDAQKALAERFDKDADDRKNRPGDLFTIFEEIPDLSPDDLVQASAFQTKRVSFDAVGGAELP